MKRILCALIVAGLVTALTAGCANSGPSADALLDQSIRAFEAALDLTRVDMDVTAARAAVKTVTYNEPSNRFWSLSVWYLTERYVFKSWLSSIDGANATVVLTYSTIASDTKQERPDAVKTFGMRSFGTMWLADLSEFTGLE